MRKKNVFERKKPLNKQKILGSVFFTFTFLFVVFTLSYHYSPDFRTYLATIYSDIASIVTAALVGFFLVNGKFILKAFIKKVLLLAIAKLTLRFFTEKVLAENILNHFIKKLPIMDYLSAVKKSFFSYSLVKRAVTAVTILGGFIAGLGLFGDVILFKTVLAQFWSYILAKVLSFWALLLVVAQSGWFLLLLDFLIIGWLMKLLNKVPFIHKCLIYIYEALAKGFIKGNSYLDQWFNHPMQKFLKNLAIKTATKMHSYTGFEGYQTYHEFIIRHRESHPSIHSQLAEYRASRKPYMAKLSEKRISRYQEFKTSRNVSKREQLLLERKTEFDLSKKKLYLYKEHK